jgi:hypothetical protein
MGGYGSGRWGWHSKRDTVEDCLALDVNKLTRDRMLREGRLVSGSLTWTNTRTGEQVSSLGFEADTRDGASGSLRLTYTIRRTGDQLDYRVPLTTTALPWGGVRWWFTCALSRDGVYCGRRVAKLYLPPGARYYGCRHCYDLTYTSCQESHKYDGMWRMLAAQVGIDPADVKRLMEEDADFGTPRKRRRRRRTR